MSRARDLRGRLAASILGLAAAQAGCCRHYCAPTAPPCGPAVALPSAVRYGEVCEAPDGRIVAQAPATTRSAPSAIASAPRPRVVVSEPAGGRLAGRGGWRRTDPDGLGVTRTEGGLADDSLNR